MMKSILAVPVALLVATSSFGSPSNCREQALQIRSEILSQLNEGELIADMSKILKGITPEDLIQLEESRIKDKAGTDTQCPPQAPGADAPGRCAPVSTP